MNSLYQTFGCDSKEELYLLIREKDQSVEPLLNYLKYVQGNILTENTPIGSAQILAGYMETMKLPEENIATIVFADTKNRPLLIEQVNIEDESEVINVLKKGINAGANSVFMGVDSLESLSRYIEKAEELFKSILLKTKDILHYNKINDTWYSMGAKREVQDIEYNNYIQENEGYYQKGGYNQFSNYYAKQTIENKDILKDVEKIKNSLKIGYQHNKQEYFGYIVYDEDNKVLKVDEISKGGLNAAVVDVRILLRELMSLEGMKGVALFHNHPSGVPQPSDEDLQITRIIADALKKFDIEYFDHFIVGMERVFSFSDEIYGFESMNFDYLDSSLARENSGNYEKGLGDKMEISKGDILKTGASDNTLVLKVKDEDAILFTGSQFIVAHGIQKEGDKAYWNWGEYYDELPDGIFEKDKSKDELEEDVEFEDEWDMEM